MSSPSFFRVRWWLWGAAGVLWLLFCFWYTNTAGPLSAKEIAVFTEQMLRNGASAQRIERLHLFMAEDDGDQFLMVNLLDLARRQDAGEQMDRYMAHMLPELFKRASHPVLVGETVFAAMDLVGVEGAEMWSSAGIVRYRSRRDLLEIALDPVFDDKHEFKLAALEKTIAVPVRPALYLSDLRLLLLLVLLAVAGLVDAVWYRPGVHRRHA